MEKVVTINQINPTMKNFAFTCMMIEKGVCVTNSCISGTIRTRASGDNVHTIRVSDATGSVLVDIATSDFVNVLKVGDILRFKNVFTTVYRCQMKVHCGKHSEIARIGEIQHAFSETPNMSEANPEFAVFQKDRVDPNAPPNQPGMLPNNVGGFQKDRRPPMGAGPKPMPRSDMSGVFRGGMGPKDNMRGRPY